MVDTVLKLNSIDLSAEQLYELEGWKEITIKQWLNIFTNEVILAHVSDVNEAQIITNTDNIVTNAQAIVDVADDLSDHEGDNTAHGVTGDNVGSEDFAVPLVGGVVLLAALVEDASVTAVTITTTDIGPAPATYDQTYTDEQTDLINECKATINNLVTDVTDLKDQLNAFLSANKTALQMST